MKKTFNIEVDCANCAAKIENKVSKIDGVNECRINFMSQKMILDARDDRFDEVLDDLDKTIGLSYVHCIHINDSKNPKGAHKDRHENIGYGTLGFENLLNVIYNKRLDNIPKILETPWIGDFAPYKEEIEMIRTKTFNPDLKK